MNHAKFIHFQCENGAIYALDENGALWCNTNIRPSDQWKPVPIFGDDTTEPDQSESTDMNGQDTRTLLQLVDHISASLAHLVDIQKQRLTSDKQNMTADTITQIMDLFLQVLQTDATNKAASDAKLADVQSKYDAIVARDTALDDPALDAKAQEVFAAAAAATPQGGAATQAGGQVGGVQPTQDGGVTQQPQP